MRGDGGGRGQEALLMCYIDGEVQMKPNKNIVILQESCKLFAHSSSVFNNNPILFFLLTLPLPRKKVCNQV